MSEALQEPRQASAEESGSIDRSEGLSDEEFSSLLESIGTFAPLLRGLGGALGGKRSEACAVREAFLLSLKPYLSPARCEAVDYLVRMGRLGDALRALR